MPTKIGHFEILSELAKSPTGAVYKANDPESGQTIALKAIDLSAFGESAEALEHALLAEAESTKVLSSPNISKVYGAGEIEGQFCVAMEYIEGNSIATMLARKEGFSIWDLLDIGRQLSTGLDHASSHNLVHYSLEPSKIMCGWDGTVKILSFGISSIGKYVHHASGVSSILYYMSPEQIRDEATDGRSNLFSLGAMFYEMVTERKAFDRDDVDNLRQCILESTPVAPIRVNPKVHPLLSDLIMKALAKDPAQRYQTGKELLDDLEKCKESRPAKKEPPKGVVAPAAAKASAQAKFVGATPARPAPASPARPASMQSPVSSGFPKPTAQPAAKSSLASPMQQKSSAPAAAAQPAPSKLARPASKLAVPKAAAAAAGVGSSDVSMPSAGDELDLTESFAAPSQPEQVEEQPSAYMSAAVADEPQVETFEPSNDSPKIAVDPMMAEGGAASGGGTSFSEISELPPLKEVYVAPPPPPPVEAAPVLQKPISTYRNSARKDEKPKVPPREVAQKAIKEIKGVPPKLYLYALGGAGILILAIAIAMTIYIHSQSSDDDAGAPRKSVPAETTAQPDTPQTAPPQETAPAPAPDAAQPVEVQEDDTQASEPAAHSKSKAGSNRRRTQSAPIALPGQLAVDSTPQGAQVQVDGATDASWVTPFSLTNLQPGQHTITVSKAGYSTDSRTVQVTSGNRATASIRLSRIMSTLIVKSDPSGASIYVDGHDMGIKTPGQLSLDKGQHVVLVRKSGYLDETMNGQFVLGQTFNFSPTLKALGNTDNIRIVGGKMSRLFGGGKGAQAGQGTVTIHTQPKGAQISINQHIIDKNSPVEVVLDPGNYDVEITMSGYAPVRKIVNVTAGSKQAIDEALQQQ
ncbi:MAG TPA: serine/threonine-protein kinase [Candidatus Sulfotelmatobacter sp.]|nr:serine/threonine-protein kinase [Candidatus Sulfotelmatobacter sp.]